MMVLRRCGARACAGFLSVFVLPAVVVGTALGSIAHPAVVSPDPVDYTPNLQDDDAVANAGVYALAQAGNQIVAGGTFRTVKNATRTVTYTRSNIMSFDATTGALSLSFAPAFNGPVWAIQPSGSALYVGGTFTAVNGVTRRALAKIDATTGALDPTFRAGFSSGAVTEVRLVNGRLIVSGTFPKRLAALDPVTGADTGYINLGITGTVASNAGSTEVYRFAVSPAGDRLVGLGNFTSVGGQARKRAFMLTLGATAATVHPWYYRPLDNMCGSDNIPDYMRDVDFSPDGTWFAFVSTGFVPRTPGEIGTALCDATARFETNVTSPQVPTWINYTGGDTLHSVAVTGAAVYVQGHQRWLDNPFGRDFAGPGAVSRPGIGAIDPSTGLALPWNPTKTRDGGGREFLVTPAGLWVGSDGKFFKGEYRWGIAFCPLPTV
jgi:Domain of unknown function (DUF5122) beta-propeller